MFHSWHFNLILTEEPTVWTIATTQAVSSSHTVFLIPSAGVAFKHCSMTSHVSNAHPLVNEDFIAQPLATFFSILVTVLNVVGTHDLPTLAIKVLQIRVILTSSSTLI